MDTLILGLNKQIGKDSSVQFFNNHILSERMLLREIGDFVVPLEVEKFYENTGYVSYREGDELRNMNGITLPCRNGDGSYTVLYFSCVEDCEYPWWDPMTDTYNIYNRTTGVWENGQDARELECLPTDFSLVFTREGKFIFVQKYKDTIVVLENGVEKFESAYCLNMS